jgi:hypothetical protein
MGQEQTTSAQAPPGQEQYDTRSRGDSRSASGHGSDAAKKRNETSHRSSGEDNTQSGGGFLNWVRSSGPSDEEKRLAHLNKDLSIKNKRLERSNADILAKNQELINKVQDLEHLANVRMTTINRQKQDIKTRDERLAQLADEQQGLEDQIRTAQLAMSKKSARPKVDLADDERTIKGNFMNLHDEVRKWSKTWGCADFSVVDNLSYEEKEKFLEQLGKVVALEDGQIPYTLRTSDMSTRLSVLCVSAMLGRYICTHVIEAPFRPIRPLVTRAISMPQVADQDEKIQHKNTKQKILLYEEDILGVVYNKLSCCKIYSVSTVLC